MNLAILSSSRADINIYTPLIKTIGAENWIKADIILFGDHFLFNEWQSLTFKNVNVYLNETNTKEIKDKDDSEKIAFYLKGFSAFLEKSSKNWDLVFALGDRYEMFAATLAFKLSNKNIAHIHGGEVTSGSFDNYYRDFITRISCLHFTSTKEFGKRVESITGIGNNIFSVGSLGIEYLNNQQIKYSNEIKNDEKRFIATLHPYIHQNEKEIRVFFEALRDSGYEGTITYPNSDYGREKIVEVIESMDWPEKIQIIPNLGEKYPLEFFRSNLIIGNSSSGIIEGGAFNKWVINIGERQNGRPFGQNVINLPFNKITIKENIAKLMEGPKCESMKSHPYGDTKASWKILNILKKIYHGN